MLEKGRTMQSIRTLSKPSFLVAALGLCALAVLLAPTQVQSVAWGNETQWQITPFSRTYNSLCTNNDPNRTCREMCYINADGHVEATGTLCCMLPGETTCTPSNLFTP